MGLHLSMSFLFIISCFCLHLTLARPAMKESLDSDPYEPIDEETLDLLSPLLKRAYARQKLSSYLDDKQFADLLKQGSMGGYPRDILRRLVSRPRMVGNMMRYG